MKRKVLIIITVILIMSCVTGGKAGEALSFAEAEAKEWNLYEVHIDGKDTQFRRANQPDGFSRDIFSLKMEDGTISGTGAPNRFSGRYTIDGQGISVTPLISTMMASFLEPENLREFDFFNYIQNSLTWSLSSDGKRLEITSKNNNGLPVRLLFQ
ncbi:MAG: META domain-containing protein [Treponema sp.]|nr:META domain-containing protein [Treponema sp.]